VRGDFIGGFFSGLQTHFRARTSAKPARNGRTELDFAISERMFERLRIGIDGNKFHTAKTGVNHAVQCVNATAADTDDLDNC
jgi:hypothetical protein